MRPHLGDHICEVGAGIGNLTRFFLNTKRLVCIEPEKEYWPSLQALSAVHRNITVARCGIETYTAFLQNSELFDSVVCVNVLEHIREHSDALCLMGQLARPGGAILLYVPACPWAYGLLDKSLGHFRRYAKKQLKHMAKTTGLRVLKCHYVNFLGAFGWWWFSRVRKHSEIAARRVRFIDRYVPYISALERILPVFVGQSLYCVLQKK